MLETKEACLHKVLYFQIESSARNPARVDREAVNSFFTRVQIWANKQVHGPFQHTSCWITVTCRCILKLWRGFYPPPSLQESAHFSPLSLCVFFRQCTEFPVCQFRFKVLCMLPFSQNKGVLVGQGVRKSRNPLKKFPVPESSRIPNLDRAWGTVNFLLAIHPLAPPRQRGSNIMWVYFMGGTHDHENKHGLVIKVRIEEIHREQEEEGSEKGSGSWLLFLATDLLCDLEQIPSPFCACFFLLMSSGVMSLT